MGKKKINKIISIFKYKKLQSEIPAKLVKLNELVLSIEKITDKKEVKVENIKWHRILDNDHSHFLDKFNLLLLATRSGNQSWAKSLIEEIITISFEEFVFQFGNFEYSDAANSLFVDNIVKGMKYIDGSFKRKNIKRILFLHIEDLINDKKIRTYNLNQKYNWSLTEVREQLASINYGKKYVSIWYEFLYKRNNEMEANLFFNKALPIVFERGWEKSLFWILQYYYPKQEATRELANSLIRKMNKSNATYDKYVMTNLIENIAIKKMLQENDGKYKRAIFQLKRDFYKLNIKERKMIKFSIYNLLKLGERDTELLWWLIL